MGATDSALPLTWAMVLLAGKRLCGTPLHRGDSPGSVLSKPLPGGLWASWSRMPPGG